MSTKKTKSITVDKIAKKKIASTNVLFAEYEEPEPKLDSLPSKVLKKSHQETKVLESLETPRRGKGRPKKTDELELLIEAISAQKHVIPEQPTSDINKLREEIEDLKSKVASTKKSRTVKQKTPEEKQKLLDHMKKMREIAKLKRANPVEPVAQPVAQPIAQPVVKQAVQPVAQPIAQPVARPVVQPVVRPNFELLKRSMRRTIIQS